MHRRLKGSSLGLRPGIEQLCPAGIAEFLEASKVCGRDSSLCRDAQNHVLGTRLQGWSKGGGKLGSCKGLLGLCFAHSLEAVADSFRAVPARGGGPVCSLAGGSASSKSFGRAEKPVSLLSSAMKLTGWSRALVNRRSWKP